jgi:pyruvate kinase
VQRLTELITAGMDVARLNFSHGTHADHANAFREVRQASDQTKHAVAILADLQGPKIRLETFVNGYADLQTGSLFTITTEEVVGTAERASTSYEYFARDVVVGDNVLLNDGLIRLQAESRDTTSVTCRVIEGGRISDRKGINLPGVAVSSPPLTEKDAEDLRFALSLRVDFVALSFVRSATDIALVHRVMDECGVRVPVIAKIEKPEALDDLDAIVAAFDAIMVARGDLGVEVPLEQVPAAQRRVVQAANRAGKPVIVATQMLESMINSSRPTRAEASDVANAVLDGADAVMLSAETSVGAFPVVAVETMRRILSATAASVDHLDVQFNKRISKPFLNAETPDAIAAVASEVADAVGARYLVALTETGNSARLLSRERPALPILAFTTRPTTRSELALSWGIETFITEMTNSTDTEIQNVNNELLRLGRCEPGDLVVIIGGTPPGAPGSTNTLRVHTIL